MFIQNNSFDEKKVENVRIKAAAAKKIENFLNIG